MNTAKLDTLLGKQVGRGQIHNLCVRAWRDDGALDYHFCDGLADGDTPMQRRTPIYLASISKLYTAVVVMQLHRDALIDIDAPLTAYLPEKMLRGLHVMADGVDRTANLTTRHLLSHTSGLPDYFGDPSADRPPLAARLLAGDDVAIDLAMVLETTRRQQAPSLPGEKAHYSDTNYQLLYALIETVSGQDIAHHYAIRIFGPLGLSDTRPFSESLIGTPQQPATFYNGDRALHLPKFMSSNTADGGLVATVDDLVLFLRGLFDGTLLDTATIQQMTATWRRLFYPMDYGLGITRISLPRIMSPLKPIPELWGHSGSTGAFAYHAPSTGLVVAGTLNQTASPRRAFQLMLRVVALLS